MDTSESLLGTMIIKENSYLYTKDGTVIEYPYKSDYELKRRVHQSFLHRGPILRYIDIVLKTRVHKKHFSRDLSTRQQQYDLYRARIVLHEYINRARRYSQRMSYKPSQSKFTNKQIKSNMWQREAHQYFFGGARSRSNLIYNQQYIGKLRHIRQLFSVSWSFQDKGIPDRLETKEKRILRRKITLDQRTFDRRSNVFEHEELGDTIPLKLQSEKDRKRAWSFFSSLENKTKDRKLNSWVPLYKKRYFPDTRVEAKPVFVGWDTNRHALVLCNHFLSLDYAITNDVTHTSEIYIQSTTIPTQIELYHKANSQKKFVLWPKNVKVQTIYDGTKDSFYTSFSRVKTQKEIINTPHPEEAYNPVQYPYDSKLYKLEKEQFPMNHFSEFTGFLSSDKVDYIQKIEKVSHNQPITTKETNEFLLTFCLRGNNDIGKEPDYTYSKYLIKRIKEEEGLHQIPLFGFKSIANRKDATGFYDSSKVITCQPPELSPKLSWTGLIVPTRFSRRIQEELQTRETLKLYNTKNILLTFLNNGCT
jgi:hypothetical protein